MGEQIFHISTEAASRRSDLRKRAIKCLEDAVFLRGTTDKSEATVFSLVSARNHIDEIINSIGGQP